jgi:hypothetical protein
MPKGTAQDGEVLAVNVDQPAIHGAVTGDHTVPQELGLLQPEVGAPVIHELVYLNEAPGVQKTIDPLPGGQLALLVLLFNRLFTAPVVSGLSLGKQLLAKLVDGPIRHDSTSLF